MAVRVFLRASLVLAAVAGCSLDRGRAPGDTPRGVADAWLAALDAGDFRTAVACLAPDTVKDRASSAAWDALGCRDNLDGHYAKDGFPRPRDPEADRFRAARKRHADLVGPVLLRHDLTRQTSDRLIRLRDEKAARAALAEEIRDPVGFLADYFEVTRDDQPLWRREGRPKPRVEAIVVRGDVAEGKLVYVTSRFDKGDKVEEVTRDVSFLRLPHGEWRVADDVKDEFFRPR